MKNAEGDRIHQLCSQIAVETDRAKFLALVEELNSILAARVDHCPNHEAPEVEDEPTR